MCAGEHVWEGTLEMGTLSIVLLDDFPDMPCGRACLLGLLDFASVQDSLSDTLQSGLVS
jgi:hypothetical protein